MSLLTFVLLIQSGQDPLPVKFIFIQDSIAQEGEEKFNLTLKLGGTFPGEVNLFLDGTILDSDGECFLHF